MDAAEWRELAAAVNADIGAMTRAVQTQSQMRAAILQRQVDRTEEQFIDEEAYDAVPGEPRVFTIAGTEVMVWKVHRLGLDLSDVKGADLYYELGDRKFVLVQYKKPNASQRVPLDDEQLTDLQEACPVACLPTNRFSCGSWYALRKSRGAAYFPACEVRELFGSFQSRKSEYFVNGLTREQFQDDFGRCHLGARTRLIDLDSYVHASMDRDRVVVHARARLRGR
jgi:hypothetical protein